jgi:hypothetical protein
MELAVGRAYLTLQLPPDVAIVPTTTRHEAHGRHIMLYRCICATWSCHCSRDSKLDIQTRDIIMLVLL